MDPGNADSASAWAKGASDAVDNGVFRDRVETVKKNDLSHRGACPLCCQTDRFVMREVVVGRGENLLAGLEWQAVINERKPHGRITRQGNLLGSASYVLGGCLFDLVRKVLGLGTPQATIDDEKWVLLERTPVLLNRLTNRTRMRSEGEGCEVNIFGREIELVAHHRPVVQRVRIRLTDFTYRHGSRGDERASRERDASTGEQLATGNRNRIPSDVSQTGVNISAFAAAPEGAPVCPNFASSRAQ